MIQVNLFTSSTKASENYAKREISTKAALSEFFKMKDENKSKVKLVVYFQQEFEHIWKDFIQTHADGKIDIFFAAMPDDEYIRKVYLAFETDCEYSCKWDDDSFINKHVWDYMIENVDILADDKHSVLLPTFSNGVPSADFFLEDVASVELREASYQIFLDDNVVPSIWNFDYQPVVNHIKSMQHWDVQSHWSFIDEHYKGKPMGVHPARFSYRYNKLLAEYTVNNPEAVLINRNYYLEKDFHTPYFCNNIFISKSDFYRDSQKLYFNHWDEGQLNDLGKQRGQTPVFVRNCFGIHMAYGCTKNQVELEEYYRENFYAKHFAL